SLVISSVSVVNDPSAGTQDAAAFSLTNLPTLPRSVAPGASLTLTIVYKASVVGIQKALLQIQTNDPTSSVLMVSLHGIGTPGTGGASEPLLAEILRPFKVPTICAEGPNDANSFPTTSYPIPSDPCSPD